MRKALLAVLGAIIVGAIAIGIFHSSDEDRIRATLDGFVKAVSVKEGDTILSRAARVNSTFADTVDDNVHASVEELGIDVVGRAKLAEDATKVGAMYQSAACELTGVTMTIDEPSNSAKVDATAIVTGVENSGRKLDRREITFLLRKVDSGWRITTIDVARPHE